MVVARKILSCVVRVGQRFGATQLDERQAYRLINLATVAPNVTLADAGTMPGFANFTIRGLGINSTIPSIEPALGVFVNGIYQGTSAGSVLELFDVESIEILRGPQATLFALQMERISFIAATTVGCSYWRGKPRFWERSPSPMITTPSTGEIILV